MRTIAVRIHGKRPQPSQRLADLSKKGAITLAEVNVWPALVFSDHVHHRKARAWFEAQSDGTCAFCRVTQLALLRHVTNTKIMGQFVQNQPDAWRSYDMLANDPRVLFLNEPAALNAAFRHFTRATAPLHGLWTEAFPAAFLVESQAQWMAFDQGFSHFAGLDLLVLV